MSDLHTDDIGNIFLPLAARYLVWFVMDNHSHLILKINDPLSKKWNEDEIIKRWKSLFSLPVLIERYQSGQCDTPAQQEKAKETINIWRERLTDISWFMRCLNEHIARKANAEDRCTGRFWEGRFKSQALLNEQALLACMVYVDLNPIRANICNTLEDSKHTSIKQRIDKLSNNPITTPIPLAPFITSSQTDDGIPFSLKDYLELTDWTGRCVRSDKRGYIKSDTPAILQKLGLDKGTWIETVHGFTDRFHSFIGPEEKLQAICKKQTKKWLRGISLCRKLFGKAKLCPA